MASFPRQHRPAIAGNDALRRVLGGRVEPHSLPSKVRGHSRGRSNSLRSPTGVSRDQRLLAPEFSALKSSSSKSDSAARQPKLFDGRIDNGVDNEGSFTTRIASKIGKRAAYRAPIHTEPRVNGEAVFRESGRYVIPPPSAIRTQFPSLPLPRLITLTPEARKPSIMKSLPLEGYPLSSEEENSSEEEARTRRQKTPGKIHFEVRPGPKHRLQDKKYKYKISQDDTMSETERLRRQLYALNRSSSTPEMILHASRNTDRETQSRVGTEADKASMAAQPFEEGESARPRLNASGAILTRSNRFSRFIWSRRENDDERHSDEYRVKPREHSARDIRKHRRSGYYR